jgi:Pin2-interacting protein X1
MLSKMGWSPGKGLGINEDGEKEHIILSIKQDNLGIGATKKTIDNWLDNSNAFDELLKGLNDKFQNGEKVQEKLEIDEKKKRGKDNVHDYKTKIIKIKSKGKKKSKKEKSTPALQISSSSPTFTLLNNNELIANASDSGSLSSVRLA